MMLWLLGGLAWSLAFGLTTWVNRRRFYRRNGAGLQVFTRYSAAVATQSLEGLVLLLARLAGMFGAGLLLLAALRTFWIGR